MTLYNNRTNSVIFCTALDEYDMLVPEDPSKNKMIESMEVFETVFIK